MEINQRIAGMLHQIADLLEYQGVQFKPAAYRRAAQTFEDMQEDITAMTIKQLKELPGVGDAIAAKVHEFAETGTISFLDALKAEVGGPGIELMQIDDLGPKRVREIQLTLNVNSVADLIAAAEKGKLRTLPRFSEKLEQKILENAKNVGDRIKRYPLKDIQSDVESLLKAIRAIPEVLQAEAAGSYRRKKETVGDIDILIARKAAKKKEKEEIDSATAKLEKAIAALPMINKVIALGSTRMAFNLAEGLRVDVRFVAESEWGSALLYFTGSKEHNISMRRKAIERGWKLNEYGLFDGDKRLAGKTEEEIYKKLDLPFFEPHKRVAEL
jgi:DNA polymerase (family X)